ncbi:hypothetical protein KCU78_g11588, partial [Aureobasidium melanogenum]
MPTGQTQLRFGPREKALEPGSIKDIRRMLNPTTRGTKITNHRTVDGLMFFEIADVRWVRRTLRMVNVRRFLVAGEDPHEEGCLAAMHLTDEARELWTTHMRGVDDTRGGIPEIAWCSSLQLKRKIFPSGTVSRSYTAIRNARRDYCKELLSLFDDSTSSDNQNWQDFQNVINRHRHLLNDDGFQRRLENLDTKPDDNDDQDDSPHSDINSDCLDDDQYRHDRNGNDHPRSLTSRGNGSEENHSDDEQQNPMAADEDFHDIGGAEGDHFDYYGNRSPSSTFIPHSRHISPEIGGTAIAQKRKSFDDIDIIDIELDVSPEETRFGNDLTQPSRSSKRPKIEPKVEPGSEVTVTNRYTTFRNMNNVIDLTGEPDTTDESVRSGSRSKEIIDLTGVEDSVVNRRSSGIELIELEDWKPTFAYDPEQ